MEIFPTIESVHQGIAHRFDVAKEHALQYEEAIRIMDERDELQSIGGSDSSKKITELDEKLQASIVTVNTLGDFRTLLEKTDLSAEDVLHTLAHENAHANVAESLGADEIEYSIMICKGKDNFKYNAWASFRNPSDWSKDPQKIPNLIRIFNAPAEYGDSLSEDDRKTIEKLRERIAQLSQ